ncbi:hypothetical protein ABEB36_002829 [Hypothenemus hampei]|uniref:Uncharacterized protein n=1 Tax=Hypothenemus hampei TaxID=57062 RepID=A0ABD1F9S9_HYPHA
MTVLFPLSSGKKCFFLDLVKAHPNYVKKHRPLEDVPVNNRIWHYHTDETLTHFASQIKQHLDKFARHWIGGVGFISWSPGSPDLIALAYHFQIDCQGDF